MSFLVWNIWNFVQLVIFTNIMVFKTLNLFCHAGTEILYSDHCTPVSTQQQDSRKEGRRVQTRHPSLVKKCSEVYFSTVVRASHPQGMKSLSCFLQNWNKSCTLQHCLNFPILLATHELVYGHVQHTKVLFVCLFSLFSSHSPVGLMFKRQFWTTFTIV